MTAKFAGCVPLAAIADREMDALSGEALQAFAAGLRYFRPTDVGYFCAAARVPLLSLTIAKASLESATGQ